MADYATLLRDHVTLTCRSIDRIFLQGYVPKLQTPGWVAQFLLGRGFPYPSSAALGKIGDAYVSEIHRFAEAHEIPVMHFRKGESKEEIARPFIDAAAAGESRVALLGIAQEKASVWRSWRQKGTESWSRPQQQWGRQMAMINHFYWYVWDEQWGPAFWKTNAYAPYPVWLCLNGHEWAKRQLDKARIGYQALDNGFAACEDPRALQRICDRLGPGAVKEFLWRWQRRLPSPFTREDLRAGLTYDLAFRQIEFSDTRIFDRPASGRAFFEGCIRDHLDLGRPDQVAIVFGRHLSVKTPGAFRTKVITQGVDPQIVSYYKSSRAKGYFKEHRGLRLEAVICDTKDFGIGRRVTQENWRALRSVGQGVNARLAEALAHDAKPAPDVVTLSEVTRPSTTSDGQHAPGLRFGDPRVMAILAALVGFIHLVAGFNNRDLVRLMGALLNQPYTSRQATYDLRRLRRKGLITRLAGAHRYELTPLGRRVAVLFTKAYGRVLAPGLAQLDAAVPNTIAKRSALAVAWRQFDHALDDFIDRQMIAA